FRPDLCRACRGGQDRSCLRGLGRRCHRGAGYRFPRNRDGSARSGQRQQWRTHVQPSLRDPRKARQFPPGELSSGIAAVPRRNNRNIRRWRATARFRPCRTGKGSMKLMNTANLQLEGLLLALSSLVSLLRQKGIASEEEICAVLKQ